MKCHADLQVTGFWVSGFKKLISVKQIVLSASFLWRAEK